MVTREQIERLRKLAEYRAKVYLLRDDAKALVALLDEFAAKSAAVTARLSAEQVAGLVAEVSASHARIRALETEAERANARLTLTDAEVAVLSRVLEEECWRREDTCEAEEALLAKLRREREGETRRG